MDFKKIIFLLVFIPFSSWSMTLVSSNRKHELKKTKDYWISKTCKNCKALSVMKNLNKIDVENAMKSETDSRLSSGTRLCAGLKGMVWILKDENNNEKSICEFSDMSVVLTDDLSGLYQKLML
jgi:hypothetical protein